jgi:hypothetical protein
VQESQQDEEIYWQTHPWSRFKRDRREWLNEKLEKFRGSGALGASRLSAQEQAELEGKTLAQIKRQIEGLEEEDDGAAEEEEEDSSMPPSGISSRYDSARFTVEGDDD